MLLEGIVTSAVVGEIWGEGEGGGWIHKYGWNPVSREQY